MGGITATLEDYLEVILNIASRNGVARSMEIASKLNVKRPTVTVALRSLADKGMVNYSPGSYITLTKKGKDIARHIDKRHHILKEFFIDVLGVSQDWAEDVACKMEHGMSVEVCRRMKGFLNALKKDEAFAEKLRTKILQESEDFKCHKSCLK